MVAYFVRRLVFGMLAFFASTFLLYTSFTIVPITYDLKGRGDECVSQRLQYLYYGTIAYYSLDKPWPMNYLSWLYDPDGSSRTSILREQTCFATTIPQRTVHFENRGLLAGDFGKSLWLEPDVAALDLYGIELGPLYFSFGGALLFLMAITLLQRRGRQPVSGSTRVLADARWRLTDLCRMG